MNENCFDIGTIQAFIDGEVSPEISARLTDHAADCDTCALALADAEEQNSLVFSALEREMNALVPTQRLWSRINETIETEKRSTPFWQKILTAITIQLQSPSFATGFGILLIVGMFAVVWNYRSPSVTVQTDIAAGPSATRPQAIVPVATTGSDAIPSASTEGTAAASAPTVAYVKETNLSPEKLRKLVTTANYTQRPAAPRAEHAIYNGYLPGEESYVKTIAELEQNVDSKKDTVLSPSSRVSYERDMAVVDDSIKKMKTVVRKDPKNQAARQVLYSSYQDKIDLLNSVTQREELMASIR